MNRENDNR
uniref:Uncharacterized protein n=1 Tax=Rhizophora mucronata TaxID=61149 RepID=A0A2P2QDY7_RHIMU